MNKQERLLKLKEAQEKISNEIEELKNEIENEKSKCWKPVTGDKIYYWSAGDDRGVEEYYNENSSFYKNKYEEGEFFPTKELCIEHHNEKVYKERWKRLSIESGEDKNPWDGDHAHWYVSYNVANECLRMGPSYHTTDANVYFSSYEAAEKAIKELGEDNVKRYIIGIKE